MAHILVCGHCDNKQSAVRYSCGLRHDVPVTEGTTDDAAYGPFHTTYGQAKVAATEDGLSFLPFSGALDRDRRRLILIGVGVLFAVIGAVLMSRELVTAARLSAALGGIALMIVLLWVALDSFFAIVVRLALGNSISRGTATGITTLSSDIVGTVSEVRGWVVPQFAFRAGEGAVVVAATPWQAGSLRRLHESVGSLAS